MEPLDPDIERIFLAKEERRRRLAALPFEEKVRIVVRMQRMIAAILRARDISVRVCDIRYPVASADTPSHGC